MTCDACPYRALDRSSRRSLAPARSSRRASLSVEHADLLVNFSSKVKFSCVEFVGAWQSRKRKERAVTDHDIRGFELRPVPCARVVGSCARGGSLGRACAAPNPNRGDTPLLGPTAARLPIGRVDLQAFAVGGVRPALRGFPQDRQAFSHRVSASSSRCSRDFRTSRWSWLSVIGRPGAVTDRLATLGR